MHQRCRVQCAQRLLCVVKELTLSSIVYPREANTSGWHNRVSTLLLHPEQRWRWDLLNKGRPRGCYRSGIKHSSQRSYLSRELHRCLHYYCRATFFSTVAAVFPCGIALNHCILLSNSFPWQRRCMPLLSYIFLILNIPQMTIVNTIDVHQHGQHILISRPTSNNQVYILDQDQNPHPISQVGIMWASGRGISCRYINKPEFVENVHSVHLL